MKIGIEAQRIFRRNKHGMDFVALETIRELQNIDKTNEYYIFVAPGEDRCLNETKNFHIVELKSYSYPVWEQISLPNAIKKLNLDLLHCTSNTAPIHTPVPLILTLHDIIFLEKRQSSSKSFYQEMGWYYRKLVVPKILPKCKTIITVSNFERNRICSSLNLSKEQVVSVYNGYNTHFKQQEKQPEITKKYIPDDDFLFFLGNTDPKKNSPRVLKAYSIYLKSSEKKRPLLIADLKEDFIDTILKEENIEEIKSFLHYPGYIANTDLVAIYNGSFAFLYPSLRESFGIPMIEAMACGTPIIAGNTSAMPEVAGEGALLVDPYKPEEIAEKLLMLETNNEKYEQYVAYGLSRAKEFSWRKSAESLLNIYSNLKV
ncbi:glycosyltransferase family 1 protein [Bacteroides sp. 214]|uniref:glycosyltransferase family 4 protein n=1 Tax=Bacteroides sp. 214 TaxID=2302935 RepID=UPI0013D63A61|nr:glycosyltransferase family 1 protein [Bacteroides sp. 214]NDW12751.1 glycosyltransferase family 1 protein [Bacteroides sp. 214]